MIELETGKLIRMMEVREIRLHGRCGMDCVGRTKV